MDASRTANLFEGGFGGWIDSPLLATKVTAPPLRPGLVPRPKLMERIDELAHQKVALISAPAGYGKTTVLCEWVHQAKIPVAWLSLDEDDNDVTRFLAYFVAAWERIDPGVRDGPLGVLAGSLTPPIEKVLSSLVNEAGRRADHFALVLDDYHFIQAPAIHKALAFIVEHLPPQMHLVLASRLDPPLPIPSLRARRVD